VTLRLFQLLEPFLRQNTNSNKFLVIKPCKFDETVMCLIVIIYVTWIRPVHIQFDINEIMTGYIKNFDIEQVMLKTCYLLKDIFHAIRGFARIAIFICQSNMNEPVEDFILLFIDI